MRYTDSQKIGKPNNLNVFGSKYTKGPKHVNQNQIRLLISYEARILQSDWLVTLV